MSQELALRDEQAPDLMEPLLGFRGWSLDEDALLLTSGYGAWKAGVSKAKCKAVGSGQGMSFSFSTWGGISPPPLAPADHAVPHELCGCGLYGFYEPKVLNGSVNYQTNVIGAIAGWGDVVVAPSGFRAQYAKPLVLYSPTGYDLERVAQKYGALVAHSFDELREVGATFAKPVSWEVVGDGETAEEEQFASGGFISSGGITLSQAMGRHHIDGNTFNNAPGKPEEKWWFVALVALLVISTATNLGLILRAVL